MASSPQTAGPALIYAGVAGSTVAKRPAFFGTTEDTPFIRLDHEWLPLMNALGGAVIGSDYSYQGARALVRLDMTKWDQAVYRRMAAVPWFTGNPGVHIFGDLGTLYTTEGAYWPLWIQFPYVLKRGMAAAGLPNGYHFYAARVESDDAGPVSCKPRKISLVLACDRVFNQKTLSWHLFDSNMSGLPKVA